MGDKENREFGNLSEKKAKTINLDDEDSAEMKGVDCQDPVKVFCQGVMIIVLGKLDVRSLAVSRIVSTDWLTLASSDQLWAPKCEELWKGKAHIPRISKVAGLSKMEATSLSIIDGKRNRITLDDLCDHAWDFHFNADALYNRRELEAFWGPPIHHFFHLDCSITTGARDVKEASFKIMTRGKMSGQYVSINWWPHLCVEMTKWSPHIYVIRKPDWSWVLADNVYCYSSIPDTTDKLDDTGPYAPQLC